MLRGLSLICLLWIVVLDEMIPQVPHPDDATAVWSLRFDLDEVVRPEPGLRGQVRPPARTVGFLGALGLPRDGENVPVWKRLNVVMQQMVGGRVLPIPDHFSVPGEFLDSTAL